MTLLAYRFALDPTPTQARALRSHAGAARVAFNWGLARVKAVMSQRTAEATYGTIVVEDLHVRGMLANHRLARHVADASFAEIRRQITYKTAWHGGTLIVADRWFVSSKTCSACGTAKTKLALSERTYRCTACGLSLDRDINAARNLAAYGKQQIAASGAEIPNGRGADRKTGLARQVAVKRQPGRATAPQTGTLPPQGESAA